MVTASLSGSLRMHNLDTPHSCRDLRRADCCPNATSRARCYADARAPAISHCKKVGASCEGRDALGANQLRPLSSFSRIQRRCRFGTAA
jgi:hypothetical protein